MQHYDVAIYGLWYGHNYGSMFTYYALSKVMELMDLTYAMIRNPLETEKNISELHRSHPLVFAENRYSITPFLPIEELSMLNEHFDAFMIGSDQMWNYYLSRPYRQSYFLDFVSDDKLKIAYATSFGLDTYVGPPEEKEITGENLRRFDVISVRDNFSKRICEEDFGAEAELVLDPVFLCPADKYDDLISESDFSVDGEFIFAYILNPDEAKGRNLKKLAESSGKKVIVVFDFGGDKEAQKSQLNIDSELVEYIILPDVREWLWLFKNAEFVITDSFHGTCFSVIFRKNFLTYRNDARGGSRFTFLLNELGLPDHLTDNPDDTEEMYTDLNYDHRADYNMVDERMERFRNRAMDWLRRAFSGTKMSRNRREKMPFEFNHDIWEEHFILGNSVLITTQKQNPSGNFAVLPLGRVLEKGRRYSLHIEYRLRTDSDLFSFHVMKKNTRNIQIVHTHRDADKAAGQKFILSSDFIAEDDYDSFMIGAMQLSGEERYISIEKFEITE